MKKRKELERALNGFRSWVLRKNMEATMENKFPIFFLDDSPHVSKFSVRLRRSIKNYNSKIETDGYYYHGRKFNCEVEFGYSEEDYKYLSEYKLKIKDIIIAYIRAKKEISTYKFMPITKACIDIIDSEDIFFNKEKNITVKSISSKEEVVSYDGATYKIKDLYKRYI